jgi:hypothetical protein
MVSGDIRKDERLLGNLWKCATPGSAGKDQII